LTGNDDAFVRGMVFPSVIRMLTDSSSDAPPHIVTLEPSSVKHGVMHVIIAYVCWPRGVIATASVQRRELIFTIIMFVIFGSKDV
tara:strand:+ start:340 stop:594 length:255 start_codon:yes stop_codon:yes gene_type:complete